MTPSWSDLWYRVCWLAYDRWRGWWKDRQRRRIRRLQAKRSPFHREPGEPICITGTTTVSIVPLFVKTAPPLNASANGMITIPRWGGNQMYMDGGA